jgi:pimeloyl-ACP methyl ester carboxylesterase
MNWDFAYRGEDHDLDGPARDAATGSFIHLRQGYTHYEIGGPEGGTEVVLVHGFSVPYFIWDPTFAALTGAGMRTLRYDLFGRGYSDRPHLDYDMELFVGQLLGILDVLGLQRVDLLGLSMGGAIATSFAVGFPQRVHRLVLIDPLGAQAMPLNLPYRLATLPVVSELILGIAGTEQMVKDVASDFFDPAQVERFQERYRDQMQYRGFKRAILSTVRSGMLAGFPEAYKRLGERGTPVLLIWGENDQTLPIHQSQTILKLVPQAEFHKIADCGHIPHYEKPDRVNPLLLAFLQAA